MRAFNIQPLGMRIPARPKVQEGRYAGGAYHLIGIDRRSAQVRYVAPESFKNQAFVEAWDQRVTQGRMPPRALYGKFASAGAVTLADFILTHPDVTFVSDASNAPFLEGHFAVADGSLLPLPSNSYPVRGKHHILRTAGGELSFPLLEVEDESAVRAAEEGFFIAKIIHEGKPLALLDEVPGTGTAMVSNFRGHLGQIFKANEYSQMNSLERAEIHTCLMEYLREPIRYHDVLQAILSGRAHDFGGQKGLALPQNTYTHTYWLETDGPTVYCLKTYPSLDGTSAGVSFADGPHFLLALAEAYAFHINNAFVGTNGRDVRIIRPNSGLPEPITTTLDGASLGDYFKRPLASFAAFLGPLIG